MVTVTGCVAGILINMAETNKGALPFRGSKQEYR
jgi:hypothetical protein